ncbi:MAG TPA: ADOP family duplicated permease [Terriglobales bacterium]|nr:ADOP family duplicated permease [Terriglobales bacterium]
MNVVPAVAQELRFALRSLRRSPALAITVVAILGIGIGASTAVFSVVDGILFRSLPYPHAEQLVSFGLKAPIEPEEFMLGNAYADWRKQQTSFASVAAWGAGLRDCDLTEQNPAHLGCADVEASLLATLEIKPVMGRNFSAEEDLPNGPRTALISYSLWRSRFAGDAGIVGRRLMLDGLPTAVVGVLPANFEMPTLLGADVLTPLQLRVVNAPGATGRVLRTLARLKPGVGAKQAAAEMRSYALAHDWIPPRFLAEVQFTVRPLRERQVGDYKTASAALLAAVLAVLLMACANIANLLLARSAGRERERAVRSALGASRARLWLAAMAESATLAIAGGAGGLAVGAVLLRGLLRMAPAGIPRLAQAHFEWRAAGFAALISLVSALLFGLAPALQPAHMERLTAGQAVRTTRGSLRHLLVAAQMATCIALLTAASLLLRSLWQLEAEPLGLNGKQVIVARIALGPAQYGSDTARLNFYEQLEARLRQLPGSPLVALSDSVPPSGAMRSQPYFAMLPEGRARLPQGTGGMVAWRAVTPEYFSALQIPIVEGRGFTEQDRGPNEHAIILSQSLAKKMFGHEPALGKRLQRFPDDQTFYTVIGIAGDVKNGGLTYADPEYYVPRRHLPQDATARTAVVIRSALAPQLVSNWVRSVVGGLDATLPVQIESMDQRIGGLLAKPRFVAVLLGIFAAMALLLAAVGLYGVTAFLVTQRTQEIGVRIALGATPQAIERLVVGGAAIWVGVGAAAGLGLALGSARVLHGLLYRVPERDPLALGASLGLLALVALVAAFVPARRAARVDPLAALRHE